MRESSGSIPAEKLRLGIVDSEGKPVAIHRRGTTATDGLSLPSGLAALYRGIREGLSSFTGRRGGEETSSTPGAVGVAVGPGAVAWR